VSESRENSEPAQTIPAPVESAATIRLHEGAHCMGLLRDSSQVANGRGRPAAAMLHWAGVGDDQ
jgi:hypothetical protein